MISCGICNHEFAKFNLFHGYKCPNCDALFVRPTIPHILDLMKLPQGFIIVGILSLGLLGRMYLTNAPQTEFLVVLIVLSFFLPLGCAGLWYILKRPKEWISLVDFQNGKRLS